MSDKDLSELSILLVDDQVFVLNHTKRVLNKMGIDKVETANNGEDVLRFLDKTEELPQLMICDLNMPGMDGIALLRHLGERSIKMGIIFVSGEDQRILQTAEALGKSHDLYILGSIQKPIKSEPLVKLLNNFEQDITAVSMRRIEPVTEKELLAGINGDAIELVYQPKVSISEPVFGVYSTPVSTLSVLTELARACASAFLAFGCFVITFFGSGNRFRHSLIVFGRSATFSSSALSTALSSCSE